MSVKQPFISRLKDSLSGLLTSILSMLIVLPIFVTLYKEVPVIKIPIGNGLRIDNIILFGGLFIIFYIIIQAYYKASYILLGVGFLGLSVSSLLGYYDFNNLYYDYSSFVYNLKEHATPYQFEEKKNTFSREALIVYAIDYNSPKTREVAANWAIKNFDPYKKVMPSLKINQALSIYKEVRNRWNYVFDPHGEDLYVKSSQTLQLLEEDEKLKGDCDDYSITMAGLIKAIGGEVQLVRTIITNPDSTITGHLYPEVKIGKKKDLEIVAYLIKNELFEAESKNKPIYYYQDKEGFIWLNFDYFDTYPGGKYASNVRVSVLKV